MKRLCLILLCVSGCLMDTGCTLAIQSPADALKLSNPAIKAKKTVWGASVEIPTDFSGHGVLDYNPDTGVIHADVTVDSRASSVIDAEAARGVALMPAYDKYADNQTQANMASIAAQQAVWQHGFETIGSVGGAFLARPKGSSQSGPGGLLGTVVPMLSGAGIGIKDVVKAMAAMTGSDPGGASDVVPPSGTAPSPGAPPLHP